MSEVEKQLGTSPDGLSQAEAKARLAQYGPNEIVEHKTNSLSTLLGYFSGPIPWMIEVAVILSGAVGFYDEHQAGRAIDALKARLATTARARRDGERVTPPARELVPGDVIRLHLGDIVPADARLLAGDEVEVDQSALTGGVALCCPQAGRGRLLGFDPAPC